MGVTLRLRVEVADEPGSLAKVAAVIAAHHANITAIEVHHAPGSIVDDLSVEFPEGAGEPDMAALRQEIAASGAGRLVSHQATRPVDLVAQVLRRAGDLLAGAPAERDAVMRRAVAEMCGTPHVWVMPGEEAATWPAGRRALEHPGEAVLVRAGEPPPFPSGPPPPPEASLLAIADSGRSVVLVARPLTQEFTTTETSRVEALVALRERLAETAPA